MSRRVDQNWKCKWVSRLANARCAQTRGDFALASMAGRMQLGQIGRFYHGKSARSRSRYKLDSSDSLKCKATYHSQKINEEETESMNDALADEEIT